MLYLRKVLDTLNVISTKLLEKRIKPCSESSQSYHLSRLTRAEVSKKGLGEQQYTKCQCVARSLVT